MLLGFKTTLLRLVVLDLIKHVLQVFRMASKPFVKKGVLRVFNIDAFVNVGN